MARLCGGCKYWVPEVQGLVNRARAKNPWPHCSLNNQVKTELTKACLVWIPVKREVEKADSGLYQGN
jgi:hypothetical protein